MSVQNIGYAGVGGIFRHSSPFALTNNQVKALPQTPITVVPAPGANRIAIPLYATGLVNSTAGAYTNLDAAHYVALRHATSTDQLTTGVGIISQTAAQVLNWQPAQFPNTDLILDISVGLFPANATNKAIQIFADNGAAGDFTGGHASNSLTVTVVYVVFDLVTKRFV